MTNLVTIKNNPVHLANNSAGTLSVSTTAADTSALDAGEYAVWCASDVWLKVDDTAADDVTTSNGYKLFANNVETLAIPNNHVLGGILATGTSTLYYHKVSE